MFEIVSRIFRRVLSLLDRVFDQFYGSKYNPLYQSGTLAVTVLTLATATGGYLLFFYRLGAPYESVAHLSNNLILSGWVRTLHRYSSDLAVVTVVFHVFRMLTEGKSWGPRLLAWITGVVMTLLMFVIGWTGFILVWDRQGQALAAAGAKMMNTIPLFEGVLTRSISGATSVGSSFFFLNLFLHMSLPLGMIFVLWLHTSNLNKPAWYPTKKVALVLSAFLIGFSFLWPASLGGPADLLELSEKFQLNAFYSFPIPLVHSLSPGMAFLALIIFFAILMLVPFFWKPKKENQPLHSVHNPAACTGCGQCALDCPFGAIEMIPRTVGTGSETIAFVDTSACVGCGICSASCTQMAIGPEDKSSRMQMQKIKELKAQYPQGGTLFVHCGKNPLGAAFLSRQKDRSDLAPYAIECTGNFHVASASFALGHFKNVSIVGCPSDACVNRLGQKLLEDRFLHGREPKAPGKMDFQRVQVFSGSLADLDQLEQKPSDSKKIWLMRIKNAFATTLILAATAFFSSFPFEHQIEDSILRIGIRLPGQAIEICRERRAEELAALPLHMRNAQDCQRTPIDYHLRVTVDGQPILEKVISATGARGDKPLVAEQDLALKPGTHQVSVHFKPLHAEASSGLALEENFSAEFEKGRAILIVYNPNTKTLFHSKTAVK